MSLPLIIEHNRHRPTVRVLECSVNNCINRTNTHIFNFSSRSLERRIPTKLTTFAFQKSSDHIFMKMAALFVRSLLSFRIKVSVVMTMFPITDNLVTDKLFFRHFDYLLPLNKLKRQVYSVGQYSTLYIFIKGTASRLNGFKNFLLKFFNFVLVIRVNHLHP